MEEGRGESGTEGNKGDEQKRRRREKDNQEEKEIRVRRRKEVNTIDINDGAEGKRETG